MCCYGQASSTVLTLFRTCICICPIDHYSTDQNVFVQWNMVSMHTRHKIHIQLIQVQSGSAKCSDLSKGIWSLPILRIRTIFSCYKLQDAAVAAQRDVQMFVWLQCVQSISFIQGNSPGLTTNQYGNAETK